MSGKAKFAVVLSGCGVFDGAEIHEAVLTLLAIDRLGASYQCYAPDIAQAHVINHLTGQEMPESRNVLIESARIARGAVTDLRAYHADGYDGLVFPGGFGAAKNLSSFAFDGPACTVNPEVERAIRETRAAGKPIGALCIAPAVVAKVLGGVTLTIGQDIGTSAAIEKMGAHHTLAHHGEVVIDQAARLVTTPCYMLESTIGQIATGAENVIKAMLAMVGTRPVAAG